MIIVIDYGVGNVRSVANGLAHLGYADKLTADPKEIEQAAGIILPGVAAFGFAIGQLGETGEVIKEVVRAGKPMLGICVGHQMLFEGSCEKGEHEGLGLIPGEVVEIPPGGGRTIPHMGWNSVEIPEGMDLFELPSPEYFSSLIDGLETNAGLQESPAAGLALAPRPARSSQLRSFTPSVWAASAGSARAPAESSS